MRASKAARARVDKDALPVWQVVAVAAINCMNSVSYLSTIPYAPFLVASLSGLPPHQVGFYTGLIEGCFHAGAVFGSFMWGALADRFGRRPVLLAGLWGTVLSCVLFGTAQTIPQAAAARALWGLLNGNIGVAKTVLSEVTSDASAPRAFSAIGIATGLGRLIGPSIGGFLSEPASKYPETFDAAIWRTYPYLLPCLVTGALTAAVAVQSAFVLEETLPGARGCCGSGSSSRSGGGRSRSQQQVAVPSTVGAVQKTTSAARGGRGAARAQALPVVALKTKSSDSRSRPAPSGRGAAAPHRGRPAAAALPGRVVSEEDEEDDEDDDSLFDSDGFTLPDTEGEGDDGEGELSWSEDSNSTDGTDEEEGATLLGAAPAAGTPVTAASSSSPPSSVVSRRCATMGKLLRDGPVLTTVSLYAVMGFLGISSSEIFPLYALNDTAHGGFSWRPEQLGLLATFAGPVLIVFQSLIYARLVKRLGLVGLTRASLCLHAIALLATPSCTALLTGATLTHQLAVVASLFVILTVTRVAVFTSIFVWVSNSARAEDRGTVNGLGQSLVSVARMIGPPISTSLFAWSVSKHAKAGFPDGVYASWPLDYHLAWYFVTASCFGALALTYRLPWWIDMKRTPQLEATPEPKPQGARGGK